MTGAGCACFGHRHDGGDFPGWCLSGFLSCCLMLFVRGLYSLYDTPENCSDYIREASIGSDSNRS
eukprot:CCRYP_016067-RA/>CCRYP_016067-RA protein AED:0.00 eAED:0.00 QI:7/1/1/1/0/0/2/152/64